MASDPFADISLANMHIGDKSSDQTQKQPAYDVWGITPTNAAPPAAAAPVAATAPAPAPPPMNAPPPMQPAVQPMNPYPPAAPQQMYQQSPVPAQYQAYQQVPPQAQPPVQYQYAPPPANATYAAAPMMAAPAPMMQAQVPPPPQPVQYQQAPTSPVPTPAAAPAANPFAPPAVVPLSPGSTTSTDRDDSPTPQRPTNVPECVTLVNKDIEDESLSKDAVDVEDDEADFWAQMGFAVEEAAAATTPEPAAGPGMGRKRMSVRASIVRTVPKAAGEGGDKAVDPEEKDDQGMPAGGKYYTAKLPSGQFGAILYSAKQVSKNIYYTAPASFIEKIANHSVVAYTSSESGVDRAGISVGDVLLKVQDEEVKGPKNAMTHIRKECNSRSGFYGIQLSLWKPPPSINVTLAENQCMVEYHIKSTTVPTTSYEWKSKYVVVGGIVAEPNSINMYYGKRDYDKAVSEISASQPRVSVKIKSWSLAGGRLLTPKPKMVHYSTKKTPWYYFVVTTNKGKAIKVAHPMLDGLKPVFDGVKRALKHNAYGGGY